MTGLTIHPIPLFFMKARFEKPLMTYLANFASSLTAVCYVWLIKGNGCRILVDAGSTSEKMLQRRKNLVEIRHIQSIDEGLARFGLTPAMIDTVVLTHLHWDHVHLARRYENAVFLVQESELAFAKDPHPLFAVYYERALFEGLNFQVIRGDERIHKGIQLLHTPGHTPGGQSVAVSTKSGIAVITGFCCLRDNFQPSIIPSGIHTDVIRLYESMQRVQRMADFILPNHDIAFLKIGSIG